MQSFLVKALLFWYTILLSFCLLDFPIQALLWTCHYTLWTHLLPQMSWEMPGSQPKMSPVQRRALRGNDGWMLSAQIQGRRTGSSSTFRNLPNSKVILLNWRKRWLLKCPCNSCDLEQSPLLKPYNQVCTWEIREGRQVTYRLSKIIFLT